MQYTKVPSDVAQNLQLNAGILVDDFAPSTGVIGNILGATTGGFSFASNPTFTDFGSDIDNMPPNTMQMKRVAYYDPVISGTFLTVTAARVTDLIGAASLAVGDDTHVVPSHTLDESAFADVWVIGDYSDKNTGTTAGFCAVHIMNALNTVGFQWTTTKDGKGQFAFEYHGHYDYENMDEVPFEVYVQTGTTATVVETNNT